MNLFETTARRPRPEAAPGEQLSRVFLLLTLTALVAVLFGFLTVQSGVHVYLIVVVAAGALAVAAGTSSRFGRIERAPRGRRSRPRGEPSLPPFLESVDRRLELASESAGEFDRLRLRLREIAEQRLAGRGLRLESPRARHLLGEEPWLLLEHAPQVDRFAPGPEPDRLRTVVEALERL